MEKVKKYSLKRSFMAAVTVTMLIVSLCSALAIFGCYRLQKRILPDSNEVWLTQQTTTSDGTVTESKQRYVLDKPSPISALPQNVWAATQIPCVTWVRLRKQKSIVSK